MAVTARSRETMVAFATMLVASAVAVAQRAPAITLKPADAKLEEEFTSIRSVRELRDGRVIIADDREQRVVVADLRAGTVTQVGRVGNGPSEYRNPQQLVPLGNDSTLLIAAGRWLLLRGAEIAATITSDSAIRVSSSGVIGADTLGFVYARWPGTPRRSEPGAVVRTDSALVVRVERRSATTDTLAFLRTSPLTLKTARLENGGTAQRWTPLPFPLNDDAIAFPDGWLAVARAAPYRVDWRAPDGRTNVGAPLTFALVELTERDRKALIDSFPPRPNRMPQFDFSAFPERVPPFQAPALIAGRDGRVLIRRTVTASQPENRYDVVDRRGALVGQLTLLRNQRIIGFGATAVYVVVTDDDGIQRLRRHPWP